MKLQFKGHTIYLDEEDKHYLEERSFSIHKLKNTQYLYNSNKNIRLHRLIMNCPNGKQIDHINGNGLDNRKENLRICSQSENHQNRSKWGNTSSQYKGVHWHKIVKKWVAQIMINGKRKHLGYFDREREAAKAYNYMAIKHFGEYARINEFD